MAKVYSAVKPFSPPIIHGHTFAPVDPADPFGEWFAEVDEANHPPFFIGVEGSPFYLKDEKKPTEDDKAPSGVGVVLDPPLSAGAVIGSLENTGAPDAEAEGPEGCDDTDPFAPFAAAKNKGELAALAASVLGIQLDDSVLKRPEMDQAIKAKLAEIAAALPPPPPVSE